MYTVKRNCSTGAKSDLCSNRGNRIVQNKSDLRFDKFKARKQGESVTIRERITNLVGISRAEACPKAIRPPLVDLYSKDYIGTGLMDNFKQTFRVSICQQYVGGK